MRREAHMPTTRCCTRRKIELVVVVDEVDRHAMEQNWRHSCNADNSFGPSGSRESQGGAGNQQAKAEMSCWYCGWKGHRERKFWKKHAVSDKSGSGFGRTGQGNRQRSQYVKGSEGAGNGSGPIFVMKHKANSMKAST